MVYILLGTGFEEADASYPASFNAHIWLADLDTAPALRPPWWAWTA